jgi:hypothetical protein
VVKHIGRLPANRRALRFCNRSTQRTTMSNSHIPVELLDHIVDHLHDAEDALRSCCLVSKSWIPRARKHLFADVEFLTAGSLQSWKETFPNPSTSPAQYASTLSVRCSQIVTDAEVGGWIRSFSRVVHLDMGGQGTSPSLSVVSLDPFHGFSPAIRSLRVAIPSLSSPHIFNLILSFPLLEDLAVSIAVYNEPLTDNDDGPDLLPTLARPPSPPMFTGSLNLLLWGGMNHIIRWLLSLPGGIHFRKLIWTWFREEDFSVMVALVEGCSQTLESLDIARNNPMIGTSIRNLRPHKITQCCF